MTSHLTYMFRSKHLCKTTWGEGFGSHNLLSASFASWFPGCFFVVSLCPWHKPQLSGRIQMIQPHKWNQFINHSQIHVPQWVLRSQPLVAQLCEVYIFLGNHLSDVNLYRWHLIACLSMGRLMVQICCRKSRKCPSGFRHIIWFLDLGRMSYSNTMMTENGAIW